MKSNVLTAASAAVVMAAAAAAPALAQPPAPRTLNAPALSSPPKALLPEQVGGSVFYVQNLEAQRAWYETMLGFRVVNSYARDGKVFEYIMQTGDKPGSPFLGLMYSASRPPGFNNNSRVVLPVPNPKALADFFATKGVYVREASPGAAYMIVDPEGNQIELYRLTAPRPAR